VTGRIWEAPAGTIPTMPVPRPLLVLVRGFLGACPNCGGRNIFEGWFKLRSHCPTCEIAFERDEGYWLGGWAINLVVTQAALLAAVIGGLIFLWPQYHWLWIASGGAVVAIVVPLAFFPVSRTLWVSFDFLMHRLDKGDQSHWLRR
jgi:uncharacterized protein (DUF983 family)